MVDLAPEACIFTPEARSCVIVLPLAAHRKPPSGACLLTWETKSCGIVFLLSQPSWITSNAASGNATWST